MPGQGRVGDKAFCQADAHGCPACAHPTIGPAIQGSPDVLVNFQPALRDGDPGIHASCCGPNQWVANGGAPHVFINCRAAFRLGDPSKHCGGDGKLVMGSGNVIVGDAGSGDSDLGEDDRALEGDPVDVARGEVVHTATQLCLYGLLEWQWIRRYRSGLHSARRRGPAPEFGPGWVHTLEQVVVQYGGRLWFCDDVGCEHSMPLLHEGCQQQALGATWLREGRRLQRIGQGGIHTTFEQQNDDRVFRLIEIRDLFENRLAVEYEGALAVRLLTPAGQTIHLMRESSGRLSRLEDPTGQTLARFVFDRQGRLAELETPRGTTRYQYGGSGQLEYVQDGSGPPVRFWYHPDGRCRKLAAEEGSFVRTFEYDLEQRQTLVTDGTGRWRRYTYDARNAITEVEGPENCKKHLIRDSQGHIIQTIDAAGLSRTFAYDSDGRLISATDGLGNTQRFTFDVYGWPESRQDFDGNQHAFKFHPSGRLLEYCAPNGGIWRMTHDARGCVSALQGPLGEIWRYEHNARGQLIAMSEPGGRSNQLSYDEHGSLQRIECSHDSWTEYTYDQHRRMIAAQRSDGVRMDLEFDSSGETERVSFDGLAGYRFSRGSNGMLSALIQPDGQRLNFSYDAEGRITGLAFSSGPSYGLEYDNAGRVQHLTSNVGTEETYQYNSTGQPVLVRSAARKLEAEYDARGLLTRQSSEAGECLRYRYDAGGRLIEASDGQCRIERAYNSLGRLTMESIDGAVTRLHYDPRGLLSALEAPTGIKIQYHYDEDGRLRELSRDQRGIATLEYDEQGQLSALVEPDGAYRIDYSTEGCRRLRATRVRTSQGTDYNWEFTYDRQDRLVERTCSNGRHWRLRYGSDGALEAYESWPSRGSSTPNVEPGVAAVAVGPDGRPHEALGERYVYDEAGRVIERRLPDGRSILYRYDGFDRLIGLRTAAGLDIRYHVDPLGRRYAMTTPDGATRRLHWLEGQVIGDTLEDGRCHHFTFLPDTTFPLLMFADESPGAFVADQRGVPWMVVDHGGQPRWQAEYDAYGRAHVLQGSWHQPLRLPGHYAEPWDDTHYNVQRSYHPGIGRYLSPDPYMRMTPFAMCGLVIAGPDAYRATFGDPWNQEDSTGEILPIIVAMLVGAAIGAVLSAAITGVAQKIRGEKLDWGEIGKSALMGAAAGAVGALAGPLGGFIVQRLGGTSTSILAKGTGVFLSGSGSAGIDFAVNRDADSAKSAFIWGAVGQGAGTAFKTTGTNTIRQYNGFKATPRGIGGYYRTSNGRAIAASMATSSATSTVMTEATKD